MAHLALETNAIYIFFSHSWGFLSTVLTVKIYCKVTHALLFVYFLLADKSFSRHLSEKIHLRLFCSFETLKCPTSGKENLNPNIPGIPDFYNFPDF